MASRAGADYPPFIIVEGLVGDDSLGFMLDTGFEADLALAASLCSTPPWKDSLEARGQTHARAAGDAKPVRVHRLLRPLTLVGRTFEGLTIIEFDDSSAPAGAEMMPIVGSPLLRRFGTLTIDFDAGEVVFGRD